MVNSKLLWLINLSLLWIGRFCIQSKICSGSGKSIPINWLNTSFEDVVEHILHTYNQSTPVWNLLGLLNDLPQFSSLSFHEWLKQGLHKFRICILGSKVKKQSLGTMIRIRGTLFLANWITLNTDGSSFGNPGAAGADSPF
ncbi:hypothetical protein M9H77_36297 [Catharanthus roseus]|uniref:Uncharacterized protein n=1 Tax=Catharanthus roseus TaxID=4058 RepID=A0ACB9ZTL7_CATRO|nr:hypothetical protein M9H77_36297 [Catharanthus roseus]